MRRQLSAGPVFGILPILYVFLARAGKTISEAETIVLDQEGNVKQADGRRQKRRNWRRSTRWCARPENCVFQQTVAGRTLYYFSGDVSNDGFRKSGLLKFYDKLGQANAFIKSAS